MQGKSDAATHHEYIERLPEPRRGEIRFKRLGDVDQDALASLLREAQQRGVPTTR